MRLTRAFGMRPVLDPCQNPETLRYRVGLAFSGGGVVIATNDRRLSSQISILYRRFLKDRPRSSADLRIVVRNGPRRGGQACFEMRCEPFHYRVTNLIGSPILECHEVATGSTRRIGLAGGAFGPRHHLCLAQTGLLQVAAGLDPGRRLFHAAALARGDRGMMLCGATGRGKTTLTLALLACGMRFLSDDVACLQIGKGILEPFPRGLWLRSGARRLLRPVLGSRRLAALLADTPLDIEDIFPGRLGEACPLRHILVLEGWGEETRFRPLATHEAIFAALRSSHVPVGHPVRAGWELADDFAAARGAAVTLGPPREAADRILEWIGRDGP